ncbi:hypothetical protein CQA78_31095, partial [Klebsiella pneumoniae]
HRLPRSAERDHRPGAARGGAIGISVDGAVDIAREADIAFLDPPKETTAPALRAAELSASRSTARWISP